MNPMNPPGANAPRGRFRYQWAYFRNQTLLERYFLAGCTLVVESSCADDAFHRVFRDLHETVCIDDSSFRQYVGRTHGNAGAYLPDFHLCKKKTLSADMERISDNWDRHNS